MSRRNNPERILQERQGWGEKEAGGKVFQTTEMMSAKELKAGIGQRD